MTDTPTVILTIVSRLDGAYDTSGVVFDWQVRVLLAGVRKVASGREGGPRRAWLAARRAERRLERECRAIARTQEGLL